MRRRKLLKHLPRRHLLKILQLRMMQMSHLLKVSLKRQLLLRSPSKRLNQALMKMNLNLVMKNVK